MKKNLKKNVLSAIAKVGEKSAVVGASSASILGFHQPVEANDIGGIFISINN